jgi:hypothetical protein
MKKIIASVVLLVAALGLYAQKSIDVVSKDLEVEKIKRTGLAVTIELDEKFVKDLWKKQLKDFGKTDSKGDLIWIEVATIPAISSTPVKLYTATQGSGKGTMVWMAVDMGDKYVTEGGEGYSNAKKFLRDFAISCYKADLEEQVKDAQKAFDSAQKEDEKVIKQGEKLSSDHQNNASDKVKLEEELKKNGEQKVQIEKDIVQNKKDQEASKSEVAKMKKALELKQAEFTNLK